MKPKKPIEKVFYNKDLNIAFNKGKQEERERIIKLITKINYNIPMKLMSKYSLDFQRGIDYFYNKIINKLKEKQ